MTILDGAIDPPDNSFVSENLGFLTYSKFQLKGFGSEIATSKSVLTSRSSHTWRSESYVM